MSKKHRRETKTKSQYIPNAQRDREREMNYHEAKTEADDDIHGYGGGSEFNFTEMTSKSLSDDVHGVGSQSVEDGWSNNVP